jgi:hypothetical protein
MSRIKILLQRGPGRAVGAGQPLCGFMHLGSVNALANGRSGTLQAKFLLTRFAGFSVDYIRRVGFIELRRPSRWKGL